jgi:hypothetical protein
MKDILKIDGNYYFGGLRNISFLLMAAAIYIWTTPFFMVQQNSLTQTFLVGLAAMLIGLLIRFTRYGYQFDFANMKFREYVLVLGIKTGGWQTLDNLSSIVFSIKDRSVLKTPGIIAPANTSDEPVFVIALYSGSMPKIVIPLEDKEEALKLSEVLSAQLNLEVRRN